MTDVRDYLAQLHEEHFELRADDERTFTLNNEIIHLVIADKSGRLFDWHTIMTAAIHEFAHVIDKNAAQAIRGQFLAVGTHESLLPAIGLRCEV